MIDIGQIKESLRNVKYLNFEQYIHDVLLSLQIPNNTIIRLLNNVEKPTLEKPFRVFKRAEIIYDLNISDKNQFTENQYPTSSICRLLLIINPKIIICRDNLTGDIIEFVPEDIEKHLHFFLPLIYGSTVKSDVSKTVNFAETASSLYNELCLDELNDYIKKSDVVTDFVIRLVYISFAKSLLDNKEIDKALDWSVASGNFNYTTIITDIFDSIFYGQKGTTFYEKLPTLHLAISEKFSLPNINLKSFNLIKKLISFNLLDIDTEILGSLIYKFAKNEDNIGIYGNFTSLENVAKVLNPLFVNKYELLIEANKTDKNILQELRNEILALKFFDPTNGPGSFLSSAFVAVNNLISTIDKILNSQGAETIKLENFKGITNSKLAFDLSKLTIWITYLQYLKEQSNINDKLLESSFSKINICFGDALQIPWDNVCTNDGNVYLIGSPTFKGSKKLSAKEKSQVKSIFGESGTGNIDFSACYLYLAAKYINGSNSQSALVITNSVCQGAQVSFIWSKIYAIGCDIMFAHRSFKWKNSSQVSSGVTVVIIGLCSSTLNIQPKYLYTENAVIKTESIGPYLINSTKTIVKESTVPLSVGLPRMPKGNMPYDNQHLLLSKEEKQKLLEHYPNALKFVKKIVGSEEFINRVERWCLWIPDETLDQAVQIPEIANRISKVKEFRLSKTDAGANKLALRPHQFREFRSTSTQTLVVPSVSSENRPYIPIGFVGKDTIVSNLAFSIYDCEPWIFGLISSKMHMIWIRTVCGSLETRPRYSSRLGYNTFPFPNISAEKKAQINDIVYDIISERERYCNQSLGDIYSDLPQSLRVLHNYLDVCIEGCYQEQPFDSDMERLKKLFYLYDNKN